MARSSSINPPAGGERREAGILFVDLVSSSEMSNVLTYEEYDKLLIEFQQTAIEVLERHLGHSRGAELQCHEASVRGDEVCVILHVPPRAAEEAAQSTDLAGPILRLAMEIKRRWLTAERNRGRLAVRMPPIELGIGLHQGFVVYGPHPRISTDGGERSAPTAEGYAVNIAKRIEGHSRSGRFSRIMASQAAFNILSVGDHQIAFAPVDMTSLRGISQPVPVYEVKSFGHVESPDYAPRLTEEEAAVYRQAVECSPHELWHTLDLAHHYYDREDYDNAARYYGIALEVDPDFAPAHMYLGRTLYRQFHDQAARLPLERARELNPGSARANSFLATCLRRLAQRRVALSASGAPDSATTALFERAIRFHETATRIAGVPTQYPWAFNAHAMTLAQACLMRVVQVELEQLEEAVMHLRAILAHSDVDPYLGRQESLVRHVLGMVYHACDRDDEARAELERAIALLIPSTLPVEVGPLKLREKLSEIQWHLAVINGRQRADVEQAVTSAIKADLAGDVHLDALALAERSEFAKQQHWYQSARRRLPDDYLERLQ